MIVATQTYETTDATADSQILALRVSGADVLMTGAIPKFAARTIRKVYHISLEAGTLLGLGREFSGRRDAASRTGEGHRHHLSGVRERPDRSAVARYSRVQGMADDEEIQFVGQRVADAANVYGYDAAQTMIAVLKACGDNLTRDNVMKNAASIRDLKLPMPAADDYAPIKQMQ